MQLVTIVLFGALGPTLIFGAVVLASDGESLRHSGVRTNATVLATSDRPKNRHCDVQLTDAAGKPWNVSIAQSCNEPVGHAVSVVYDPRDPTNVDFPQNLGVVQEYLRSALLAVLGLLAIGLSVWALRASRERFSDINRRFPRWRKPEQRPTSHRDDR